MGTLSLALDAETMPPFVGFGLFIQFIDNKRYTQTVIYKGRIYTTHINTLVYSAEFNTKFYFFLLVSFSSFYNIL